MVAHSLRPFHWPGRENNWFIVTGRLKPGVTVAQIRADLATIQSQLGQQFPETDNLSVTVEALKETTIAGRAARFGCSSAPSLLLLIACTNIIALLLSRSAQRQHEISVRSLGSFSWRPRCTIAHGNVSPCSDRPRPGAPRSRGLRAFRSLAAQLPRVKEFISTCALFSTPRVLPRGHFSCWTGSAIRGTRRNLSASLASVRHTSLRRIRCNGCSWESRSPSPSPCSRAPVCFSAAFRSFAASREALIPATYLPSSSA